MWESDTLVALGTLVLIVRARATRCGRRGEQALLGSVTQRCPTFSRRRSTCRRECSQEGCGRGGRDVRRDSRARRCGSGPVGPGADGVHLDVPHHPGAARRVVGLHDLDRQLPGGQARRPGRADAGPALVEVHGRDVRGGRGDRHRAELRVRPAVAAVHGPVGCGVRGAVRVRGFVLLHRGDLRRDLHLRLAPAEAVGALLDRCSHRPRRDLRQRVGGRGQRVDERTVGLHAECRGHRGRGRPATR